MVIPYMSDQGLERIESTSIHVNVLCNIIYIFILKCDRSHFLLV